MDRFLRFLLILYQLVIIYQSISIAKLVSFKNGTQCNLSELPPNVCKSELCQLEAKILLSSMDLTADPCDDFFEFACGTILNQTVIAEDKLSAEMMSASRDELSFKIRNLLKEPVLEDDPEIFRKAKHFYAACVNTELIEALGSSPVEAVISSLNGWPVLLGDQWNESNFHWDDLSRDILEIGGGHAGGFLFKIYASSDEKNITRNVLHVDQTPLGLPIRPYMINGLQQPQVQAYLKLMVDTAVLLGGEPEIVVQEMTDVINFEVEIARFSLSDEERKNQTLLYNKMTLAQLQQIAPEVDWLNYFNIQLPFNVTKDDPVIVRVPQYVVEMTQLIKRTNPRTLANYMIWRTIESLISYLDQRFVNASLELSRSILGQQRQGLRWKECERLAVSHMDNIVGAMYVTRFFREDARKEVAHLVSALRQEFKLLLQSADWMDEITHKKALKKLEDMVILNAYPDDLRNLTIVNDLYKNLHTDPNDHFGNVLRVQRFTTKYLFLKLKETNKRLDWETHGDVASFNAYYLPAGNAINILAGILDSIFFQVDRPRYMNFARLGYAIGHEITHGFDDIGSQFDNEGNLLNWWDDRTKSLFNKRISCVKEQFDNYEIPELNVTLNGANTVGENVADIAGLKLAYKAFTKALEKKKQLWDILPCLDFTREQLFWLSFANMYCGKYRPEYLALVIMTDEHSPNKFRVNGPISNQPEFARDFNCPEGSKMNPRKKCVVW